VGLLVKEVRRMRLLSKEEIRRMLALGKMLPESDGTAILDEFEEVQPDIYQAIFGELSSAIEEDNKDMANLFLDLCFDIIWVYRKSFGKPPMASKGDDWVPNTLVLLDAELKSLLDDTPMHGKLKAHLQKRFIRRCVETGIQTELLEILTEEVMKYAAFKKNRRRAIPSTSSFLFVIVRLMDELYSRKEQ
jgi:hypothetical protein